MAPASVRAMAGLGPGGAGWADATREGSRRAFPFLAHRLEGNALRLT